MKLQISVLISMAAATLSAPQTRQEIEVLLANTNEEINLIDVGGARNQVKQVETDVPLGSQFAVEHLFPERVGLVTGHRIPIDLFPIETQSRILEAPSVSIRVPSVTLEAPKLPKSTLASIDLDVPSAPTRSPKVHLEAPKVPKSTPASIELEVPTVPTRAPGITLQLPKVPKSTESSVDLEVPNKYVDTASFRRKTTSRTGKKATEKSIESLRFVPEILEQPRGEFDKTYERSLRIFSPPSFF